jgi:hypothetical protein
VERIVRGWRQLDRRAEARLATRQHAGRGIHVYRADDGMVVLRGRLDPETGALLLRALDAARETLYQRTRASATGASVADPGLELPTRAQQQADALGLLAESALHHELDPGAPGERYQVVIHVDAAVLADPEAPGQSELQEVGHVPAGTLRRLACDASRVVMRHDAQGRPGDRGPDAHYPAGAPKGSESPRSDLSLPGLRGTRQAGPSRASLGAGRVDDAVESRPALSAPSPRGSRGGLLRGARAGWHAAVHPT